MRLYFTVLLLGNNIRSTICDGVLLLICGHKGIASEAMHATSMRAITVISSFLYSWTRPFITRGGRVWYVPTFKLFPRTAIMYG